MIAVSLSTAQSAPMRDPNSSSLTSSSASSSLKVASSSFKLPCVQIVMGLWQLITWRYSCPCLQGAFWHQSHRRKSIKQRTKESYELWHLKCTCNLESLQLSGPEQVIHFVSKRHRLNLSQPSLLKICGTHLVEAFRDFGYHNKMQSLKCCFHDSHFRKKWKICKFTKPFWELWNYTPRHLPRHLYTYHLPTDPPGSTGYPPGIFTSKGEESASLPDGSCCTTPWAGCFFWCFYWKAYIFQKTVYWLLIITCQVRWRTPSVAHDLFLKPNPPKNSKTWCR